jgi:hypothetical protein
MSRPEALFVPPRPDQASQRGFMPALIAKSVACGPGASWDRNVAFDRLHWGPHHLPAYPYEGAALIELVEPGRSRVPGLAIPSAQRRLASSGLSSPGSGGAGRFLQVGRHHNHSPRSRPLPWADDASPRHARTRFFSQSSLKAEETLPPHERHGCLVRTPLGYFRVVWKMT